MTLFSDDADEPCTNSADFFSGSTAEPVPTHARPVTEQHGSDMLDDESADQPESVSIPMPIQAMSSPWHIVRKTVASQPHRTLMNDTRHAVQVTVSPPLSHVRQRSRVRQEIPDDIICSHSAKIPRPNETELQELVNLFNDEVTSVQTKVVECCKFVKSHTAKTDSDVDLVCAALQAFALWSNRLSFADVMKFAKSVRFEKMLSGVFEMYNGKLAKGVSVDDDGITHIISGQSDTVLDQDTPECPVKYVYDGIVAILMILRNFVRLTAADDDGNGHHVDQMSVRCQNLIKYIILPSLRSIVLVLESTHVGILLPVYADIDRLFLECVDGGLLHESGVRQGLLDRFFWDVIGDPFLNVCKRLYESNLIQLDNLTVIWNNRHMITDSQRQLLLSLGVNELSEEQEQREGPGDAEENHADFDDTSNLPLPDSGTALPANCTTDAERRYTKILSRIQPLNQENILEFIQAQSYSDMTRWNISQMRQALHYFKIPEKLNLDMHNINATIADAFKIIHERREDQACNANLTRAEMETMIRLMPKSTIATIFCFHAFLSWHFRSTECLRPEHFTVGDDKFSVLVVHEKFGSKNECRVVKGIPKDLNTWSEASANTWQPVVDALMHEVARGERSILNNCPPYNTYQCEVKKLILRVAPRLQHNARLGPFIARRTGAGLHMQEGWKSKTVMCIGGWRNEPRG